MNDNQILPERSPLTAQEQQALLAQDALIEALLSLFGEDFDEDHADQLKTGFVHLHSRNRMELARLRA